MMGYLPGPTYQLVIGWAGELGVRPHISSVVVGYVVTPAAVFAEAVVIQLVISWLPAVKAYAPA